MQLAFLKSKSSKRIAVTIFTIFLFLLISFLMVYQTQIYQGKIWAYLGSSTDRFHMMRIEGLYHSLQRHQYFPLVNMSFMGGFGYLVNVFNSDFLMYPGAILRLMGFSSAQTLVGLNFLFNFLTFGVAFLCFYKVSKKYMNSLVFSFVYTMSTYRLHEVLFRHDIGEVGALLCLPVAMLGIYEIFYGDRRQWLYLAFGMTEIIYSQAIAPILVAVLIVIIALCQINELKKAPKRLLSLLWAALSSGLMSLAYFLPMIEQMHHTKFILGQSKGMLPKGAQDFSDVTKWSFNNTLSQPNIGITLILAAIIILISYMRIKNRAVKHFAIIGAVMLLASSKLFPWFIINATPLKVIQYPWHFDMIITLLLAIFVAADPLNIFTTKWAKSGLMIFVALMAFSASSRLINDSPLQLVSYDEYNDLDSFSIGTGQGYLPAGTSLGELQRTAHKPKIQSGKAKISNFRQYGTRLSFDFKNAKHAKVDLPIIGYYGFQSSQSTGQVSQLKMDKKNNNLAQVKINGKGKVIVDYFETATQKVTRRISFLSFLIIVAIVFINKLNLVDFDRIEGLRKTK
ncbi:cell surface protein precursor [Companilactobacillus mindensis DSM 14500]|uniref:Cell surface protein n=1 Tax=Companilactobacillus mindensis DSM 14500 TaxID=1423770 RepID=A0A0R1QHV9_9LACO|nr:hypothetical protein [Companilactobacillus mindensis]KRL44381.1 cell surface protein precursor [Companilactobacillus mindensis DSM 14500]GEO79371.1 hypothetical protein LMI01_17020 [Companilactobacillus mindensis]